MSRIPPCLLYLTIYNPTLRPTGFVSPDDDDAEEQAHILFYTSKERAVSRDRMLRQVGLAKALVNFSEMFSTAETSNNIHSQSKRMVMVSPEPDFWIHAAVELAKTPRSNVEKAKSKGKEKEKDKGKAKEQPPAYDYHDGSVYDSALRARLERGYEMFKLTHGSWTSILSTLGQEALELQLERFFTVWAWRWDFENGPELSDDLGVPLHPFYRSLLPLLDTFGCELPEEIAPIVVSSPHLIPSTRFSNAHYLPSLSRHLLSLTLSSRLSTIRQTTDQTINAPPHTAETIGKGEPTSSQCSAHTPDPSKTAGSSSSGGSGSNFLSIPAVNVNMDMRKWSWPGVLTFKRSQGKKVREPPKGEDAPEPKGKEDMKEEGDTEDAQAVSLNVDTSSLEDAMASDARSVATASVVTNPASETDSNTHPSPDAEVIGEPETINKPEASPADASNQPEMSPPPILLGNGKPSLESSVSSPLKDPSLQISTSTPTPEFSSTMVHLPVGDDALVTKWRKVLYLGNHDMIIALVEGPNKENQVHNMSSVADKSLRLLADIQAAIEVESEAISASLPSATKILQPKDRYMISREYFTDSTPGFAPRSEQFYSGKQLLNKAPDISEVFSRGQHPQHWHVARRGLGVDDCGNEVDGEVLLEVSRKEASLTDVDNVLVSLVKRFN